MLVLTRKIGQQIFGTEVIKTSDEVKSINDQKLKNHDAKKENEIRLQGLSRSDESVSLAEYFANSYETAEEEGKVVLEKGVVEKNNCFFAKGYWSNKIYESRFIEVTWLRKSDVVVFEASFDIADTTKWNERLKRLLESDSKFKE